MRRLPLTWRLKAKYCRRERICRAMAPSTLSLFLTALMFAGVSGADKELGEVCATGDMCVHPSLELTCDAFAKKCLIQQGKACNGDGHEYLCVTGAECTTDMCTCVSGVYTVSGVTCTVAEDKYGGTCLTGDTCTAASNLECANTFCGCTAGNKPKLSDGTCEANADNKVGQVCTTGGGQCGVSTSTFMSCPTTGTMTCTCDAGYTGPVGGACAAIAQEKVGRVCTTANAAEVTSCGPPATTNLECSNLACACKDGYYGVTGGECVPAAGKLNGGCSGTEKGTCADSDALCTGSGAKLCKRDLGGACTMTSDCADASAVCDDFAKTCLLKTDQTCNTPAAKMDKCVSGASCETTGSTPSNQCKCIDTVYTEDTTKKICNAAEGKATGACKSTVPECDDANAECVATKCTCNTGYKLKNADATCEKSGAIPVIASTLTVMLVAVSGHIFTLH